MTVTSSLEQVITERTCGRSFGEGPLPAEQLATLLYLGNGVRQVQTRSGLPFYQRNVPNSGNLGSVEIFPIIMNVRDVEPGIYHFDTIEHHLANVRTGQYREWLREKASFKLSSGLPHAHSCSLSSSADYNRSTVSALTDSASLMRDMYRKIFI